MPFALPEIEPFVTWEEIESHPDYQTLPEDKQWTVKANWFGKIVESSPTWEPLPEHKKKVARHKFLVGDLPKPQQEALIAKYPEFWATFVIGGGAARLPAAAIKGARALPSFLKGAGEVALTLEMMEKGYEVGAWAGGKLTGESEWGRLIGGSLVAGLLPVGAYYAARSIIAKEAWPTGKQDTPRAWKQAYEREFEKIRKLLAEGKKPRGRPRPGVRPIEPSWDDLMKKYGSPENLWEAEGGMFKAARKYDSVREWLSKQRQAGDQSFRQQADARAARETAKATAEESEFTYWESKLRENEEIWAKANKTANARRASGETKPQDRNYSLTVVEDTLPTEAARETGLSGRAGTKPPLVTPEVIITPPPARPPKAKVVPIKKAPKSFIYDLIDVGGINEKTLPGEIRDLVTGISKKGKLQRAKGVPPGLLNKKGRGIDERTLDMRNLGYDIRDDSHFVELLEKDIRAIAQKKPESRVYPLTDVSLEGRMWDDYIKEAEERGISEREATETLSRERQERVTREITEEEEFARFEREAIQAEYNQLSQEQATFIEEEAPWELTAEEPPPEVLGPQAKKAVFPTGKVPTVTKGEQVSMFKRRGEQISLEEKIEEVGKKPPVDTTFEFLGMQRIWEEFKTLFTETTPTTAQTDSAIRPIADEIKGLFKKFYGLDPAMKRRFTSIEESREIIRDEVLDQIFNKGLPDLTKKEATALTWHRSDRTKYPLPTGRQREADFIDQTLEFAIQEQEKRGLSARWPDSAIKRIQQEIDNLEQEIQVMVNKKAKANRQTIVNNLRQVIEELKVRRYVPHIAVPSFTRKVLGFIETVKVGGWKLKQGEKLSSQVKRFLGRKTLSLEEFVEAAKKMKVEPELDIRVLLADYLNYTMDKVIVYDEVERIKQMPDLVLPVAEMPSDWKAIKGVKQLDGYGAHPFMADAITEFTGEYATRNMLLKYYDTVNRVGKFIVFYNPMIMTVNDISQIYMGGALISREFAKTMLGFAKPELDTAVKDVMTRSPLMKESQKLGLFSTPWRGAPNMIESARMWASHVESTKPEWHRNLEKAVGKEIDFEKWINPIIVGKDFYDTVFKVTWTLDRIWRMTQVRDFMRKGMNLPDAVERTRKMMVQYDYLPNKTRVFLNRIFLTPTYRVGMQRLYGNLLRHPAEKIALPYKGIPRERIPWEERMAKPEEPEWERMDFSRENMKVLGRYALLKFLIYAGAGLFAYTWMESYRLIKRKETGEEEIFTLPGPIFELEKLFGRAWTNSLYLNLARIPYILVSINPAKNRDWKGDQIVNYGAPKHVIGGQIAWYITKTYLAPLERFAMLSGDEQDAIGKTLSFLAISKYTRQSPHSWRGYQIYKATREYNEYVNPRKPDETINEKKRPSPRNQVLANEKWQRRLESINEEFNKRQRKLGEPIRENLFWKIFLGEPQEVT